MTSTVSRFKKTDKAENCSKAQAGAHSPLSAWRHARHHKSIAGNTPKSFDHEKPNLKCYRNSGAPPDPYHPRHRHVNNPPPSSLGVFRKQANWRNEPNLVFCQVSEFKQHAIIFRAAQGQKRTQIEPKQTQNEPNFKENNAILTVRTGLFWHCLCRK